MSVKVDLKYNDGEKLFLTSDTHFKHSNILKFCNRPFQSVEEMDEALIRNWNEVVPEDGIVFHLGDFGWGGFKEYRDIRERLNGEIILIKGNHDFRNGCRSETEYDKLFKYTAQQMIIQVGNRKVILNHCPLLCYGGTYRNKNELVYQLHGHVHMMKKRPMGKDIDRMVNFTFPTQYDVGVDFNDYRPVSWQEVDEKIRIQVDENRNQSMWIEER